MQVVHVHRAASLTKRAQLAGWMLLGCVSLAWTADKVAELSDDFLEYLGSLEGSDDTWMDFTADAVAHDSAHDSVNHESAAKDSKTVVTSSSSANGTTKAASTVTGKADK